MRLGKLVGLFFWQSDPLKHQPLRKHNTSHRPVFLAKTNRNVLVRPWRCRWNYFELVREVAFFEKIRTDV